MYVINNEPAFYEKAVEEVFSRDGNGYLIIDPILLDKNVDRHNFIESIFERVIKAPLPHPELDSVMALWIIPLNWRNPSDREIFKCSINCSLNELSPGKLAIGGGRCICGWVSSTLSLNDFAEDITRLAIQPQPSGSLSLFRYYDPAVLSVVTSIIDDWQRKRLFNNIHSWSYLNGDGYFNTEYGANSSVVKMNFSLGLTDDEILNLNNVKYVNAIASRIRIESPKLQLSESQLIGRLLPALRFFTEHFSLADEGIVIFGVDIFQSRKEFYKEDFFLSQMKNLNNQSLPSYIEHRKIIGKF